MQYNKEKAYVSPFLWATTFFCRVRRGCNRTESDFWGISMVAYKDFPLVDPLITAECVGGLIMEHVCKSSQVSTQYMIADNICRFDRCTY